MKITRIQIDRFGLWRDLDLPLYENGVTVFYGPNEAGKSTLLRFVRGMLYGFPRADLDAGDPSADSCGGALEIEAAGRRCRLERRTTRNGKPELSVQGWNRAEPPDDVLASLTCGAGRQVFENVFALGLTELQQLATLHAEEVAGRLYGASLGTDGRRLLNALQKTAEAKRRVFDSAESSGRLADLLRKDGKLQDELQSAKPLRDEYDRLVDESERLAADVRDMRNRQSGMESQLRGHRFLQRVWGPWKQVESYREELAEIPELGGFPTDGLERLKELDVEIQTDLRCRHSLLQEVEQLKTRRRELEALLRRARKHRGRQRLQKIRERCDRLEERLKQAGERSTALGKQLDDACRELGGSWNEDRLQNVDASPVAQSELLNSARKFQAAIVRRGRFRREYNRRQQEYRKRQSRLKERLAAFEAETAAEAIERQQAVLQRLRRRRELEEEIALLERRRQDVRDLHRTGKSNPGDEVFPAWFRRVLWFFGVAGAVVTLLGIVTAATFNALAGAVLSLSGLTGLGVAWGLQHHSDTSSADNAARRERNVLDLDARLETAKQELRALEAEGSRKPDSQNARSRGRDRNGDGSRGLRLVGRPDDDRPDGCDVSLERAAETLAELESLKTLEDSLQSRRQRLVKLRTRFASIRQDFGTARQEWCEMLSAVGLEETLAIDDAFQNWERVLTARERLDRRSAAERKVAKLQQRLERLQRNQPPEEETPDDPTTEAAGATAEIPDFNAVRRECRQLKTDLRKRRREAADYERRLGELRDQQAAILEQAGAQDAEDFERRAELFGRREETAELLKLAEEELREAAETEPELAVVEEDLLAYDADEHAECIRALEAELADLGNDLQRVHEQLGGLKQSLESLENNRTQSGLRLRRRRIDDQLENAVGEWAAAHLLRQSLETVRTRFEREHQPAVLATASQIFEQMTAGRYRRLWTPLGRRRISAEDAQNRVWNLDDVSGGTREQIFLALRLALVEELSEQGIELPMILDDVLVNCDSFRTEAAVDALLKFAETGRQVVFLTCHRHIAELFAARGIAANELPEPHSAPRRLAG